MAYDFIIFDCDGVVVDTETTALTVLYHMVQEEGLNEPGPETFVETFRGAKIGSILETLEKKYNTSLPPAFMEQFRQKSREVFQTEIKLIDGIEEVLQGLKLPFCMASNSPSDLIRDCLSLTNLLPYFEGKIFSAYDLERWKPDPFLFQYAANQFGFQPQRCLVVEDSVPGVQAAIAASMSALGYGTGKQAIELEQEGAMVISDMRDVLRYSQT